MEKTANLQKNYPTDLVIQVKITIHDFELQLFFSDDDWI